MRWIALLGSATALSMSGPAGAADRDDTICADRPGLATPACTVPAGMVQIETSLVDWVHDRPAGLHSDQLAIGQTSVKLGLTDRFHVEVGVAPYMRVRERAGASVAAASGFGDVELAAKYRLSSDGRVFQLALRPSIKIPTARGGLGNGRLEGALIVPVEYAVPHSPLSIGLSPQLALVGNEDRAGYHLAMTQVLAVGAPLGARFNASAEVSGTWDWDAVKTVRQYAASASLAYLPSSHAQLDAGVVVGLNHAAPDLQLYSGIAIRF